VKLNLADPAFEPSDEDLIGLAQRAFAHVREANAEALRKCFELVDAERRAVLKRLEARP
jgi:hypothetical protein